LPARVRSYWFDHPSSSFVLCGSTWTLRFFALNLARGLLLELRLQPWAASQRQPVSFWGCSPCRTIPRFAPSPRERDSPERVLACSPTPPELHRPSGGVIAGVRSSRAYLPRHLPPLTFLKPSTVCSSRRLACLLSYRHHLWDSKNTNGPLRFLVFLTGPSGDGPVRDDEARTLLASVKTSETELLSLVSGRSALVELVVSNELPACHSPNLLQAVLRGGGLVDRFEPLISRHLVVLVPAASSSHPHPCKTKMRGVSQPSSTRSIRCQ